MGYIVGKTVPYFAYIRTDQQPWRKDHVTGKSKPKINQSRILQDWFDILIAGTSKETMPDNITVTVFVDGSGELRAKMKENT